MGDIDTCAVMFKYPSGLLAMVDTSRDAAYGYDQRVEAFGERGMVSAKNELTSTVELATASGHLTPCAQWSFPQRYAKAYAIELAEFIQMLRAGSESDAHKKEQEMMQRHPRLIRTTVAAELSWHLNRTVRLDEVDGLVATDAVSAEKETIISTAPPQESDLRGAAPSSEEDRVLRTYRDIHRLQTVEGVKAMRAAFRKLDKAVTSIEEMICFLDTVVDESDPDEGLPRSFFAYQLAESMMSAYLLADREKLAFQPKGVPIESLFSAAELRELPAVAQSMYAGKTLATLYPHVEDWSWLPLTALMHDLGKVCMHETFGALPQWSIVGDTFVVGCDFDPANVFAGRDFYSQNPDSKVQGLQGKLGMYSSQCGFDNVLLSFGHNEYLATVLEGHAQDVAESTERPPRTLPREAVYLIRYQSFQPWHSPPQGQARGYAHLASEEDWRMLPLLKALHKSSAGARTTALPPIGEQHAFYGKLLSDYFLTQLRW
uniref:Inositol oxygenase n=1 Tax=Strombidinopsis acuminata TaxID=141414 RepID=A0A7S3U4U1_9SPIT